jgi:SNF2 family DNA or RNA helicase
LIVAPLILLDTRTWEKEMENFFTNDGVIFWPMLSLHGDQLAHLRRRDADGAEVEIGKPVLDLNRIQRHKVVITNYETLKNYQHSFAYMKDGKSLWSFVVSDEAQEFKIPSTKLSHAMKAIEADLHIACTGTPVENRLLDLWNLCDVLQRGLLGSAKEFVERFEGPQEQGDQERRLLELKKTLLFQQRHAFLLRRTKSEVADLPPKQVVKLDCNMSDEEITAHQALLRDFTAENRPTRFLSALHRFAQLYQHPALLADDAEDRSAAELIGQSSKLRAIIATLHRIRARREKAIVFARHRAMQGILAKVLQAEFQLPVRIINGETKLRPGSLKASGFNTRNAILDDFRGKLGFNVIVLSPFVAGIGLTIVEANHVVHYGRWWNPAVESQATDRAYRIGQTKEVSVYLPILRDPSGRVAPTFDERLDLLMERKQRLAEDFLRPLPPEDEMGDELFTGLKAEAGLQS